MGAGGRAFKSPRPDQQNQADAGRSLRPAKYDFVDALSYLTFRRADRTQKLRRLWPHEIQPADSAPATQPCRKETTIRREHEIRRLRGITLGLPPQQSAHSDDVDQSIRFDADQIGAKRRKALSV